MLRKCLPTRFINSKRPPLKVYWMIENINGKQNFGDELTPIIIKKIWGYRAEWKPVNKCRLACVGSIIEVLDKHSNNNKIKVWGSGFIQNGGALNNQTLDYYAVRGKSSLGRLGATPQSRKIALGDPGILANQIFDRSKRITHKVGIVAHYIDMDSVEFRKIKINEEYKIISPLQSPQKVAEDITSCEIVFSSSLHGLIFADSFGVPNYWMPFSDKVVGGSYKFEDYYLSIDRKLIKKPLSLLSDDSKINDSITSYEPVQNLKRIQRDLIRSFPY